CIDVQAVSILQGMCLCLPQSLSERIDEHAVRARVFDEIRAVYVANQCMAPGDVRVGKDPIVVRESSDGAADLLEYLPARGAQVLCPLAHDLQNKNHGSRLLGQCGCGVIFFQKADAVATKASSSRLRVPPMLCLSICGTRDNRRYVRAGGAPAKTAPN